MSTHTTRTTTPPPSTASRTSTPAYHSSIGDSTRASESLDESWYPVNPISPINSEGSDDDTLSSSIYSIGSDTAASLTSTESESDVQVEEEIGGEYIDAESSTIGLGSQITLPDTSNQLPLIFPHYDDLENSFASNTSDGTTPSASVQLQTSTPVVVRAQRSSSYRLSLDKSGASDGNPALWGISMDGGPHQPSPSTPVSADKPVQVEEKEAVTAQEIREGVKSDRLRRALVSANLANVRGGQKWSLKMSIFTLASLLGLVMATVRYSFAPASSSASASASTPESIPTPAVQVKPFSILDYLPSSSLMEAPSSILPDVRLIKNALTLSSKALPPTFSNVPPPTSKSKEEGDYAIALSDSDYGLMTFLQNSGSTWRKAKEMVSPSSPIATAVAEGPKVYGYGEIMLSDLKAAWSKTLSSYSHAEFIHYLRDQFIAKIQLEIQQAIILANYLLEVGKNASRAATPYIHLGYNRTMTMYDQLKSYSALRMPTTDIAAEAARTGLDSVTSKAAMTSQKGRKAIQQARAGLDHLVSEARRRAGASSSHIPDQGQGQVGLNEKSGGKFSSLKNKIRYHRGKAVQNPGKAVSIGHPNVKEKGERVMSMKERFMLALHNAAMPLVV